MSLLGPYELNQIYTGDAKDLLAELPDACIDLTVTSPPYDNLRDYEGYTFDFEPIAAELFRVTKLGGVAVWIIGDQTKRFCESLTSAKQKIYFVEVCGFNLLDTMIYLKSNYVPAYPSLRRYASRFEYMLIFCNGKPKSFSPIQRKKIRNREERPAFRQKDGSFIRKLKPKGRKTKDAANVWEYAVAGNLLSHPAVFPEALARDHILSWSSPGDVVLDPMVGSGTTPKMAKQLGRQWLGFDISPEYVELAQKRVSQAQPPLFTLK